MSLKNTRNVNTDSVNASRSKPTFSMIVKRYIPSRLAGPKSSLGKGKEDESKKRKEIDPISSPESLRKDKKVVQSSREKPLSSSNIVSPTPVKSSSLSSKLTARVVVKRINTPRPKPNLGKSALERLSTPLIKKSPSWSSISKIPTQKKTQKEVVPLAQPQTLSIKQIEKPNTFRGPKVAKSPRLSVIDETSEQAGNSKHSNMTDNGRPTIEDVPVDGEIRRTETEDDINRANRQTNRREGVTVDIARDLLDQVAEANAALAQATLVSSRTVNRASILKGVT